MEYNFQILTDGVSDLRHTWLEKHPYVSIVDTPITVFSGPGKDFSLSHLSADDFTKIEDYIKQGYRAITSQPQVYDPGCESHDSVETITRHYLDEGKDVIYVVMNSSLSGTFGTVSMFYEELQEEYQGRGRKVICVDSECMSTGLAMLIIDIAKAVEAGNLTDVDQIATFVSQQRSHIGHFFTWSELSYIKKSGRVSSTSALAGNILGLRLFCSAQYLPDGSRKLEHVTPDRVPMLKLRGLNRFAEVLSIYASRHIVDPKGDIIIAHGNAPYDATIIQKHFLRVLPEANYLIGNEWRCGAGIQAHGGPTSIHVNFHTIDTGIFDETIAEVEQIIRDTYRL